MTIPTVLMATWSDGVYALSGGSMGHELAGHAVRGLTPDGLGGALAIVDGSQARTTLGQWRVALDRRHGSRTRLLRADRRPDPCGHRGCTRPRHRRGGPLQALAGFDAVPGRDKWYAGAALVDGKLLGPPLGVRSMTMTCDGAALLVNVHVGGIPRSTDGGASWQPTIDIDADVHEVQAHPKTARCSSLRLRRAGLCVSRDAGATWTIERDGLHATYCSAVAFAGDDILVAASTDHFAAEGAIYRRPVDRTGPFSPVGGGLPTWISGICDTGCIAVCGSTVALADRAGNLYLSDDLGRTWSCEPTGHSGPSSVAVLAA